MRRFRVKAVAIANGVSLQFGPGCSGKMRRDGPSSVFPASHTTRRSGFAANVVKLPGASREN